MTTIIMMTTIREIAPSTQTRTLERGGALTVLVHVHGENKVTIIINHWTISNGITYVHVHMDGL